MFCKNCGTEILDDSAFCPKCGAKVNGSVNSSQVNNSNNQESSSNNNGPVILNYESGMDYNPISMWGYFGYGILFAIPFVGFILAIVFSFGGTKNINLRNYSRSLFCAWIIVFVLFILLGGCTMALAQHSTAHNLHSTVMRLFLSIK